jgi:hypothetical protein
MSVINYRRHSLILVIAAAVLTLPVEDRIPNGDGRFVYYFGLIGALHAASVALSVERSGRTLRGISFVLLAAVLSLTVPFIALFALESLPLPKVIGDDPQVMFLFFGSAAGAFSYWILVRQFWLRSLGFWDLATTIVLCGVATLLSFPAAGMLESQPAFRENRFLSIPWRIADSMPTLAWWVAFSVSLYLSEKRKSGVFRLPKIKPGTNPAT